MAVAAALAAWPLLGVAAAATWLAVGRPILFRQLRVGRRGTEFHIEKFRTMTNQKDEFGRLLPDEARTPRLMRVIRRSRLDELPQLFAVIRGEMSLVGPRPLLPDTIARFGGIGQRRCAVAPGLTGWAQVNGNSLLDDRQKLALDLWYIDHRSFWLDLRILGMTLGVLLFGERVRPERVAAAETHLARTRRRGSGSCAA